METYEAKKNRILKAKETAAKANPGKAVRLKPGESNIWNKIKSEVKPKVEKDKTVKVPRKRKLSPETVAVGEMSDKGLSVAEIALKTGEHGYKVKVRLEVWEKYRLIN